MQIKGIKRGKNIELLEELNIPDGSEVIIKVQVVQGISDEERLQKMKEFLATPREGRKELVKILNELDRERHAHWDKPMEYQNIDESNLLVAGKSEFGRDLAKFHQETDLK